MPKKKDKSSADDRMGGPIVLVVGLALCAYALIGRGSSGLLLGGLICTGVGLIKSLNTFAPYLFKSRQLPKKQVMKLAEERKGLLTLSEIATTLDIEPDIAKKTLEALSKDGIATQRWAEVRKNLWEFPDYMKLPIPESIDLAKAKGGRLSVDDLVASGHSRQTALDTLNALSDKGLAQSDPAAPPSERSVIITTQ